MTILAQLLRGAWRQKITPRVATAAIQDLPAHDGPCYIIGDLHGCRAAYLHIESVIAKDAAQFGPPLIILLGDIIDRGPDTATLLDHLIGRKRGGQALVHLMGNHEEMMLAYLRDPAKHANWLDFGGYETLASYGMTQDLTELGRMSGRKLSQTLAAHIPQSHVQFLEQGALGLRLGSFILVHAGLDADCRLDAQPIDALLWGRAGRSAPGGMTLVHGHTVVEQPFWRQGQIALDTGAYATGRLSCLRLLAGRPPAIATIPQESSFSDLTFSDE